jgi:hypothetical protein
MRGKEEYTKTIHLGHSFEWMREYFNTPRGVNIQVVGIPEAANQETIVKFITNALYPNPVDRKGKEDIDDELRKCKVITDRVRSRNDYNRVSQPQIKGHNSTSIETILEDLENTELDHCIKRAKDMHKLPNGKTFGKIW